MESLWTDPKSNLELGCLLHAGQMTAMNIHVMTVCDTRSHHQASPATQPKWISYFCSLTSAHQAPLQILFAHWKLLGAFMKHHTARIFQIGSLSEEIREMLHCHAASMQASLPNWTLTPSAFN